MPSPDYYKRKCERLTSELAETQRLLRVAQNDTLIARTNAERAAKRTELVNVARDGRTIKFTFMRNNVLTEIETYGTWDVNLTALTE